MAGVPTTGVTTIFWEEEVEGPHPEAVTVTVAVPENELLQVMAPVLLLMDPAAAGATLHEYDEASDAEAVYVFVPPP